MNEKIYLVNAVIDNLTMEETIDKIVFFAKRESPSYVVPLNVDCMVRIEKDKEFAKICSEANLVLADGKPLLWMAKKIKSPLKEKISGSDLFPLLCKKAAEENLSMFFLGAAEGVADKAAENLKRRFPDLKVTGTFSPPYGFENNEEQLEEIVTVIKNSKPSILILALGAPKQEKFIYKYLNVLNVPVAVCLGASLDFEAGKIKRAPKWMSNVGLEWFYRFLKEPKRLFKRYFVDDVKILKIFRKHKKENIEANKRASAGVSASHESRH